MSTKIDAFISEVRTRAQRKSPPHHESVVEVNRDEAEVWGRRRLSTKVKCDCDSGDLRARINSRSD
jgi:hypothetical protein